MFNNITYMSSPKIITLTGLKSFNNIDTDKAEIEVEAHAKKDYDKFNKKIFDVLLVGLETLEDFSVEIEDGSQYSFKAGDNIMDDLKLDEDYSLRDFEWGN